ncbi:MAG TPA: hypothetical protein VJL56_00820 [Candidatus Bathyarchaeia archaeon]|nr:hypothetical protein [Candidatus Bathyarchaeia archaeon]
MPLVSLRAVTDPSSSPKKTRPLSTAGEEATGAEGSVAFAQTTAPVLASKATNCPNWKQPEAHQLP